MNEIKVGDKFLSNGVEVEIVCVTGKINDQPIIDNYASSYTINGHYFVGDRKSVYDLQAIPVKIEEGIKFRGPEYREEFIRLRDAGRKFELEYQGRWSPKVDDIFHGTTPYRLIPQCLDAVGNPLKVGDRVRLDGIDQTITDISNGLVETDTMTSGSQACRLLKTIKRPLCVNDLDKAPCPMFLKDGDRIRPMWNETKVWFNGYSRNYNALEEYQWRPSADKPWGPCEINEEVLA